MAEKLKAVLTFSGLVVGAPVTVPHGLNWVSKPVQPDIAEVLDGKGGYAITANEATLTITRTTSDVSDSCQVLVESWHSQERAFGAEAVIRLSASTLVLQAGTPPPPPIPPQVLPTPGFYGLAEQGDLVLNSGGAVDWSSLVTGGSAMLFFKNLTITNNTILNWDFARIGTVMALFVDGTLRIDSGSAMDTSGVDAVGLNGGLGGANSKEETDTAKGGDGNTLSVGNGGDAAFQQWAALPKAGGNGGSAAVNAGGMPSSPAFSIAFGNAGAGFRLLAAAMLQVQVSMAYGGHVSGIGGSQGGGAGGSDGESNSGAGGGGGGTMLIFARHVQLADGTLISKGGNGSDAQFFGSSAGGGGGGLGGNILLFTQDEGTPASVCVVTGGGGGLGTGPGGRSGQNGSNGEIIIVTPTGTTWTS